ncbi:chymotrypsin-like protease CTRL-1 isoform X2 [Nematostella vectensis]|uniref:chymotrypsin-like protease CTRL-1 isoform X2 n=1 Tax=Nematostella vectensis TaxID=45351 RepID=UPI0020771C11|nr:chymotrypsin-like protease CTRL-1 isoform X2 [Nematostella vectensis]
MADNKLKTDNAVFVEGHHHIVNRGRLMLEWLKQNEKSLPLVQTNAEHCGVSDSASSRVVSGDDATLGEWPWQAWLHVTPHGFVCGGSLIAPQWVLTAGHCILTEDPKKYRVVLGDVDRDTTEGSEQIFHVRRIIKHPHYSRDVPYDNDVALLQLSRPAFVTSFVNTVCLPAQEEKVPEDSECYISGWGQLLHPGSAAPVLQQARMPVVSNRACAEKLNTSPNGGLHTDNRTWEVTDSMVCAGDAGITKTSGCYGDSGGPFVCKTADRWVLQGVVSWGDPDCSSVNHYTVFARVGKFVNWIRYNIQKYLL